jgi:hypothetical protein
MDNDPTEFIVGIDKQESETINQEFDELGEEKAHN